MKTTQFLKNEEVTRAWVVIDAAGKSVGRIATLAANRLNGKYQPKYTPHVDSGDFVVIINADQAQLTGKKTDQKSYFSHSGFPGGISETAVKDTDSTTVIEKAVYGMLPANKLKKGRMQRLKIYAGNEHEHNAQKPKEISL